MQDTKRFDPLQLVAGARVLGSSQAGQMLPAWTIWAQHWGSARPLTRVGLALADLADWSPMA
jgi:hypothetical protein